MKRLLPLAVAALALSGCGLRPLYSGGSTGTVATTLAAVDVGAIEGKAGWLMGNALRDRFHSGQGTTVRYRLEVKLDDKIIGLGIRRDDSISRERRTLRARYQLVDLSNGSVLLDAAAGSDAGIDSVGSEYATIAAENSALERLSQIVADQILTRVATYVDHADRAAR
ncbi:LPS assembly lipoprotein LptE [Sphingomonas sp. PAMC 26617]|uniref:LPS assembly lipoprotein LptE n=1 Tax=Sphingomonas sp. PAMC 26617 TaxID=1112216 RepID=UPI000289ACA8|nr:LPS assembly lipoprotein LptE [Sphingomonas sp. PAMC 26617]